MAIGFPAYHTEEYATDLRERDLWEFVQDTLDYLNWRIKKTSRDEIVASVPVSFFSWGERITIEFLGRGELRVTSRCAMPTQWIDWGKNKGNVEKFLDELEETIRAG